MLSFETKTTEFGESLKNVERALIALSKKSLLVGIVSDENRKAEPGKLKPVTNSDLGFIHEFGAPEVGIPARPILFPVLNAKQADIQAALMLAASYAIQGDAASADKTLHALGINLVLAIKKRILDFIPPPLAAKTLLKWVTLTKKRKDYGDTPLKVTMQFVNSFNYVLRERS